MGSTHERRMSWVGTLRDALQLLWSVADAYTKRRLFWAVTFTVCAAVLTALTPIALKLAVDSFASGQREVLFAGPIILIALYVFGLFLTRGFSEVRFLAHGQSQGRMAHGISLRVFEHLLRLPLRFHLERKTGAMNQLVEQGITGCEQLLHNILFTLLPVAFEFAAVAVVLLHFDYPAYLLILVVAAIAYLAVFHRGVVGVQEPSSSMATARVDAHATLTDSLLNYEAIKYYDAERAAGRRYDSVLDRVELAWRSLARQRATNGLWMASVFTVTLGGSLIYAAYDVNRGAMTVGDFVLVNAYIMRFVQPLELLGYALRDTTRALAFLPALFDLLRERAEPQLDQGRGRSESDGSALTFEDVSFCYQPGRPILSDINLHVPANRTLAVVGTSGSGKSSLIRLLFRLYEPDAGRILLDGTPIAELSLSALRRSVAIVPQDTVLFHDTIANNIAAGKQDATWAEIERAAKVASLHEFILRQPDGYETLVGERGLKLSGGERQRVAIARAALKCPKIFVFDEATSSLDSRTEREILRNLAEVAKQSTTLVIAHRLSTVLHADQIVVLHRGNIVERGTHQELVVRDGHYAALWRAQQGAIVGESQEMHQVSG